MKRSERAMQVWQILVAAAHNRQSLTYGHVAQHLEFEGAPRCQVVWEGKAVRLLPIPIMHHQFLH